MFKFYNDYKNLVWFGLSIFVAIVLYYLGILESLVQNLQEWGYVGAFLAGFFFSSAFTAAISTITLFTLGEFLNPWVVATLGGFGAMIGDYFLYRLIKENLMTEIKKLLASIFRHPQPESFMDLARHWQENKIWSWFLPIIACLIIASPLPDELGVAIFSSIGIKVKYLFLISFVLNSLGILAIVMLGWSVRH